MIEETNKTRIGKDVIESLTLAMYDDPMFIYREYIQNAADQIDIALEEGMISSKEECRIEIKIDKPGKIITISDNATGVQKENVLSVLKSIAQGVKDRTKHKGFRGIGRLGGLAYCDKLIFETSFKGENVKSILIWNAKELKQIINDRTKIEDATEVIDLITDHDFKEENEDKRYFKVILKNVTNDILLNHEEVYNYLSMVAPVPYNKGFFFQEKIYARAKEYHFPIDEYNLYINNNQVFKEYTTTIYEGEKHNKKRSDDEIFDIDFFDIKNKFEEILCWGWYSVSTLKKQMPPVNIARGIRLRKGNIQIGNEKQLVKLFKEPRGSFYFFGEVHATSSDLIPNARRDYFTENKIFKIFEKGLESKFRELHELYHFSSSTRSEKKKIDNLITFTEEFNKKVEKGFTRPQEKEEYEDKLKKYKEDAEKASIKIEKIKNNVASDKTKKKIVEKIAADIKVRTPETNKITNKKPKLLTDNLQKLNRHDRKLVGKILSIIDNILKKDLSDNVKQKIIEELNKSKN